MNKKVKIWIISVAVINIVGFSLMYISKFVAQQQAKKLFSKVKNNDKVFVYETYSGALNNVLYVEKLKDTTDLIDYYYKLENKDTAYINFDIKFMPLTLYKPIYTVRKLGKASKIIEVVDFNTKCWGYIKGYICYANTHRNAPSDSLVHAHVMYVAQKNSDKEVQKIDRIYKKISEYGWYCNE
jgi:hypothetical protein